MAKPTKPTGLDNKKNLEDKPDIERINKVDDIDCNYWTKMGDYLDETTSYLNGVANKNVEDITKNTADIKKNSGILTTHSRIIDNELKPEIKVINSVLDLYQEEIGDWQPDNKRSIRQVLGKDDNNSHSIIYRVTELEKGGSLKLIDEKTNSTDFYTLSNKLDLNKPFYVTLGHNNLMTGIATLTNFLINPQAPIDPTLEYIKQMAIGKLNYGNTGATKPHIGTFHFELKGNQFRMSAFQNSDNTWAENVYLNFKIQFYQ